jgi:eukaryotic-like serine/threonine-protein kinase
VTAERIGSYEVLGPLGQGGMAEVLHVRAVAGRFEGRQFALKRLLPAMEEDPKAVELFTSEAELSRHLHHPNIVEVFDVGMAEDSIYMVMELIDGRDVGQIIKRCRTRKVLWPVDFAVYLTRVLLDALGYAHAATGPGGKPLNLIHCDVSPSNFFVSRTGDLKLGDFGVARSFMEGQREELLGKPYYLSPEVLEGQLTPALDLWAVAVTLYECLTLQRPFQGGAPEEIFGAIRKARYRPVSELRPDVPRVVDGVMARAFDEDQAMRFATAEEFAQALAPLYDERVGTPLAISAVVRGLFGPSAE